MFYNVPHSILELLQVSLVSRNNSSHCTYLMQQKVLNFVSVKVVSIMTYG